MKTKNSKVLSKSSDLTPILYECFGKSLNLVRIKFISLFICSLCKVQTVGFKKLQMGLKTTVTQILHCDESSGLWQNMR